MTQPDLVSGPPKPHPQFLYHRPHRPWQINACRPAAYLNKDSHPQGYAGQLTALDLLLPSCLGQALNLGVQVKSY